MRTLNYMLKKGSTLASLTLKDAPSLDLDISNTRIDLRGKVNLIEIDMSSNLRVKNKDGHRYEDALQLATNSTLFCELEIDNEQIVNEFVKQAGDTQNQDWLLKVRLDGKNDIERPITFEVDSETLWLRAA